MSIRCLLPGLPLGLILVATGLLLGMPCSSLAGEEAAAAARAVIAKLSPPTPAITYDYEGDVLVGGLWSGETRYTAKAVKVGRQSVWRVTEDTYLDYAGAETRIRVMVHLKPDLSILSGSYERKGKLGAVSLAFSRTPGGLLTQRTLVKGKAQPSIDMLEMKVDPHATASIGALLLFLRGVPINGQGVYELPWISNREFQDTAADAAREPLRIELKGAGSFGKGKHTHKTRIVECRQGKAEMQLHLTEDGRRLVGIRRSGGAGDLVPRGEGGERLTATPEEPATTWKQAFLKFGFGYHLPRRSLLESAFHWDEMYKHETEVLKRWDPARGLDAFKAAWIEEFVTQSKNRSIQDARRLLSMTLGTGKLKKETKTEIVFAAHRQFGGGVQRTYYLLFKDGVWGITRIDF